MAIDAAEIEPALTWGTSPQDVAPISGCVPHPAAECDPDRRAAPAVKDRKVADHSYAMMVPGSGLVKAQAQKKGLDKIIIEAGFDFREPGCSICLAMNPNKLLPQERCLST